MTKMLKRVLTAGLLVGSQAIRQKKDLAVHQVQDTAISSKTASTTLFDAALQKTPHSADRASVKSNMTFGDQVVAQDEEDAMRLYNMKAEKGGPTPMAVGGFPMYGCIFNVTPEESLLKFHSPGVLFRYAPRMDAVVPHAIARWGLRVAGWDTGLGFIKMPGWQHRYLPLKYDGKPVMRCTDDWSPGTYGGAGGGVMAYTNSTMATYYDGKSVPVKVLRKGTHDNTYDVRVMVTGMPEYDVPDVPAVYLDPPPTPIADAYGDPEIPAGVSITLNVKEPIAGYPTIPITMLSTETMKTLFDKMCTAAGFRRGFVCEKRSIFTTPAKKVEEHYIVAKEIFGSDTPDLLNLADGDQILWYRYMKPTVPEPF